MLYCCCKSVMTSPHHTSDLGTYSLTQHGALDILQAPISEQADRLHFLTAKWQHMLQRKQPAAGDFAAGFGDSAPDCFSLDMAHISPLVSGLRSPFGWG